MDMINQILPFYNAIEKQEKNRYDSNEVRLCPRNQLLPFLIKRTHSASNQYLTSIKLVDSCETETEILEKFLGCGSSYNAWASSWSSVSGYATAFTTTGFGIAPAITRAAAAAGSSQAKTNSFTVTSGEIYLVKVTLTLTSGQAPTISFADSGTDKSNAVQLSAGVNTVILKATASGNFQFTINNTAACDFALSHPDISRFAYQFFGFTSVDYFQYNGGAILDALSDGHYYLKAYDGVKYYYSEWFKVQDLYHNLITEFTNSGTDPFDTLTSSGVVITYAQNLSAADEYLYSDAFAVEAGETIRVIFILGMSGVNFPTLIGVDELGADMVTGDGVCVNGRNEFTLVCSKKANMRIGLFVTDTTNFYTSYVYVKRNYSEEHSKLTFTNSLDLGDILYQKSLVQQLFCGQLLKTDPKQVITAQERAGIQIVESAITLPQYRLVEYCAPQLMQVLKLIPGHSTVTVTDETGVSYSPDNIEVNVEEIDAEVFKVEIKFTDNEIVNTLNQSNIT